MRIIAKGNVLGMGRGVTLRAVLGALLAICVASHLPAQHAPPPVVHRPAERWYTLRLEHFDVHYPEDMAEYARAMASRMESMRAAVVPLVGHAPRRTQVVIDEAGYRAGGTAWPGIDHPLLMLWPEQRMGPLGRSQSRLDNVVLHEITHTAHGLPPRRAWARLLPRLVPPSWSLSPLPLFQPVWAGEGYATWAEGRLMGGGTPHSALRAALLRQWALDDRFPSYTAQNGDGRYLSALMPYGTGSAFIEWLAARHGDEPLRGLWPRVAAGTGFDRAFAEQFGAPPADLYRQFATDVVHHAHEARDSLTAAGLVQGDVVRRIERDAGAPAISPDGRHLAMTIRRPGGGSSLVVWEMSALDSASAARPMAELAPRAGRGWSEPRFIAGTTQMLVVRSEPRPDGTLRADLFAWNWARGTRRRITRGAGIHTADPAPDGRSAVADRCLRGTCDLVRVDLRTGAVRTLAPGGPFVAYSRPRWSADGRALVAARKSAGRWRIVVFDSAGGAPRDIDPDDGASRYAPAFAPDGSVVAVSESGGIQNLVRIDPRTRSESVLTRVTGAALSPAPHPDGDLYFLRLGSHGLDLARLRAADIHPLRAYSLPPRLAPIVPPAPAAVDSFVVRDPGVARPYGIGPSRFGFLPLGTATSSGRSAGLAIVRTDPVGRLTVLAQGAAGSGVDGWRGASLAVAYRGARPLLRAEVFSARGGSALAGARYDGGAAFASIGSRAQPLGYTLGAGATYGALRGPSADASRTAGMMMGTLSFTRPAGARTLAASIDANASLGATRDTSWTRIVGSVRGSIGGPGLGLDVLLTRGMVSGGAPSFERFAVGGAEPLLFDAALLTQQIAMPALPGAATGETEITVARAGLTGGWVEPYLWTARAGSTYSVVGAERSFTLPHMAFARLPGLARARTGIGYSLDGPASDRLRGYVSVSFRP